ncbi:MAG: hypothetical protein BHW64_02510 [Candidatus Melainabacteria bacterium LEY3_CP_29_8]|nr:MAG: hypothetical protein BHW64_02510 [Candidatus Melainabacteria bacterium LEY3_CP_29_8]
MKIVNINTRFAMQRFGSRGVENVKKTTAEKIKPEVSSIVLNIPRTSQMLRKMHEYKNQIDNNIKISESLQDNKEVSLLKSIEEEQPCNIVESLKQLELSLQNEIDYINNKISTENFINKDNNGDTLYYMPYNEEYVRYNKDPIVSSPTFNPGIYNEEKVQTQNEILQNKILENRIKHKEKYNLEADKRNEIDKQRFNIALFLSKFLQILKKINSTQIELIRKQIAEILDTQKVLFEDIMQTSIQLYHQYIYQKRKQNPDYELSMESFDDNRKLLNKTQYGKLVNNSIIEKINSTECKKNLKVMENIFSLDLNKDIQNVFNVFNDIFLYMNQMFDEDIEYRKKYLDIIAEAIILNSGEEKSLPQLSYSSYQNPHNNINMLQISPTFETDFEVDINNLELSTDN